MGVPLEWAQGTLRLTVGLQTTAADVDACAAHLLDALGTLAFLRALTVLCRAPHNCVPVNALQVEMKKGDLGRHLRSCVCFRMR